MAEQLRFDLLANDRASAVFDKVGKSASDTAGKFSKVGKGLVKFGKVAAVGLAAGGAAAVIGGKHFLTLATDVEAMGAKAKTVFGGQLGMVDKWADKNAAAMGLTGTQATGLAANFADLLIPMGFARKDAAKMSTQVVGLSGALSQWSGGTVSASEASDVLAKAMLGERDGLKALGISISDADVKARLLKNGQDKLTGAALQQATAQATQQMIMEKSTDAQAAYAKGGSPLLSSQAKIKAAFGELQEKIATGLMPVFGSLIDGVASVATAFQSGGIGAAIGVIGEKISAAVPVIKAKLTEWGKAFVDWVKPMIPPMLAKLKALSERLFAWVGDNLPKWVEQLTRWGEALIGWIAPMIPPMLVALAKLVLRLTGWVITRGLPLLSGSLERLGIAAIRGLMSGMGEMFGNLTAKIDAAKDRILNKFTNAATMLLGSGRQAIAGLISGIGEKLADLGTKIGAAKDKFINAFSNAATLLVGEGRQVIAGLIGGVGEKIVDVGIKIGVVKDKITGAFSGAATMLSGIGGDIVQGLVNGITGAASRVASAVAGLVAKIPGPIRKIMGIASPSKVMAKIGEQIGDGLAVGMNDSQRAVSRAAGDMLGVAGVDGSSALTLSSGSSGVGGSGSGGGVTLNVTINGGGDPNAVVAALHQYVKRNGLIRNIAAA